MIRGDILAIPVSWRRRGVAVLLAPLALAPAACSGSDAVEATVPCVSPISAVGTGEGQPALKAKPRTEWPAVVAIAEVPEGATGVSAYWRFKGEDGWPYESVPIPRRDASEVAFIVGDKSIEFTLRYLADRGSSICSDVPQVEFAAPQPRQPLEERGVTFPEWLANGA